MTNDPSNGNGNGGDQGGNGGHEDETARRFLDVIQATPLGRMAEHQCASLAAALSQGKPITREIMVDFLETLGDLIRKSQHVTPDVELAMEMHEATPFIKRLAAMFAPEPR